MKRFFLILIFSLAACWAIFAQNYLPKSQGELVQHSYYTLSYSEEHEQAEWVYYTLSPALLSVDTPRSDDFRADGKVSSGSATLADYRGSGYDRGHLCPAGSMVRNGKAMSESFFMSNMSPQSPSFNRGVWKQLEERVRAYALADSVLHVVTGPIFTDPLGSIGENCVTVPRYYYKALYSPTMGEMLGFVMENRKLDGALESYACSIDHIEQLTGIDLFASVDEGLEVTEASYNLAKWFEGKAAAKAPSATQAVEVQEVDNQCQGLTASGARCKRKAQSGSKFCWQHQ